MQTNFINTANALNALNSIINQANAQTPHIALAQTNQIYLPNDGSLLTQLVISNNCPTSITDAELDQIMQTWDQVITPIAQYLKTLPGTLNQDQDIISYTYKDEDNGLSIKTMQTDCNYYITIIEYAA